MKKAKSVKKAKKAKKSVKSEKLPGARVIIIGAASGIAAEIILALAAAFFLVRLDAPEKYYGIMQIGITAVSGLCAGGISSLIGRKNGLVRGVSAGLLMSAFTLAAGIIFPSDIAFSLKSASETVGILALCGALGGYGIILLI